MKFNCLALLVATVFLSSCASTYYASNPGAFTYKTAIKNDKDRVEYYFIFDVLKKMDLKKYANKERRKKVNMVAVKMVNNSDSTITLDRSHFSVISDNNKIKLYTPEEFYQFIKQKKGFYFFWVLFNPSYTTTTSPSPYYSNGYAYVSPPQVKYHSIPIGIPLALYNFFRAKAANKKLRADLKKNYLIGKSIPPGGVAYGYIYMQAPQNRALTISLDYTE